MSAYAIFLAACLIVLAFLVGWRSGRDHERRRHQLAERLAPYVARRRPGTDDTAWPWPAADIRAAAARQRQQPREP